MTIYVDPSRRYAGRCPSEWCHLATDGALQELHEFARALGLPGRAFHRGAKHPHYDLTPAARALAVSRGAIEVSSKDLVRRCFLRRTAGS